MYFTICFYDISKKGKDKGDFIGETTDASKCMLLLSLTTSLVQIVEQSTAALRAASIPI